MIIKEESNKEYSNHLEENQQNGRSPYLSMVTQDIRELNSPSENCRMAAWTFKKTNNNNKKPTT
jgi:hypothetical protein